MFYPVFLFVLFIADLIHDIKGIAAIRENRLVKAHGALDGVKRINNIFFGNTDFSGNLMKGRLFHILADQIFLGINGLVGGVLQGTADADGIIVTEKPSDFANDHGHGISTELYI